MEGHQPNNINPNLSKHQGRQVFQAAKYIEGVLKNDRSILGQAITIVESSQSKFEHLADEMMAGLPQESNHTIRIGITGSPGVGKSTLIEKLGLLLVEKGLKVAVLAIDPTSSLTSGSILGDKTRMDELSRHPSAFIRPTAAGKTLGGVAQKTKQTIQLCEAAGYEVVIVETVGVGQSETLVDSLVDFFLLLVAPGAGDELQGIKRGIVEIADMIAINKSDGELIDLARKTKSDYLNAVRFFPPKDSGWPKAVINCSATHEIGIEEIWDKIQHYCTFTKESAFFEEKRNTQEKYWLHEIIKWTLKQRFYNAPLVKDQMEQIEQKVSKGILQPMRGAKYLIGLFDQNLDPGDL